MGKESDNMSSMSYVKRVEDDNQSEGSKMEKVEESSDT